MKQRSYPPGCNIVRLSLNTVELLGLVEVGGVVVDVPTGLLVRYANAMTEMNKVQKEFQALLDEAYE